MSRSILTSSAILNAFLSTTGGPPTREDEGPLIRALVERGPPPPPSGVPWLLEKDPDRLKPAGDAWLPMTAAVTMGGVVVGKTEDVIDGTDVEGWVIEVVVVVEQDGGRSIEASSVASSAATSSFDARAPMAAGDLPSALFINEAEEAELEVA